MENYKAGDSLGNGRYKLQEVLGEGTYGVVWLAEDTQLQIKVAIKTLHTSMGKISDLRREAVTQARLNHPNIASIYSVDIDERFIAIEYVEGKSLEKYLKDCIAENAWIDINQSMQFLSQCFNALIYAHSKQVIHGDIKPGNIMIHNDGTIKLTDFGVAKIISEQDISGYSPSAARRLGSITYMAPEVISGVPRDFKSDIFSLGVVAYLLLTGHHPFFCSHPSGLFSIKDSLLSDSEVKNPKEIIPNLSDEYANAILKMVSKDPNSRYSDLKKAYEEFIGLGLKCHSCQFVNPVTASFCMQCGSSLKRVIADQFSNKTAEELWVKAYQLNSISQFEEAVRFCDEALKIQSNHARLHQTKAFALSNLSRFDEALLSYELALSFLEDKEQEANIHTNMSYIYLQQGNKIKWREELEKALECNPSHYKARYYLEKYALEQE
jgi:serine/threonine-protein kinase